MATGDIEYAEKGEALYADAALVSVVIPTYNRSSLIMRSINSVLGQTYKNIEILVVDDCSTDDTQSVIESIQDDRVRYLKMPTNSGAAAARNYGVRHAVGDFVAFQDSDDEWRPDKLEKQLAAILQSECDVCLCRIERHGYADWHQPLVPTRETPEGFVSYERVLQTALLSSQALMAPRVVFERFPFDEQLRWCEDLEWSFRVGKSCSLYLMDDVLVDIYLQEDSITNFSTDFHVPFYRKAIRDFAGDDRAVDIKYRYLINQAICLELQGKHAPGCYWKAYRLKGKKEDLRYWRLSLLHKMPQVRKTQLETGELLEGRF